MRTERRSLADQTAELFLLRPGMPVVEQESDYLVREREARIAELERCGRRRMRTRQ